MSQRHIRYFQEFLNHEDYIIINKDNYISNTRELYYTLNSEGELSLSLFVVYPVKFIMRNTTNDTNIRTSSPFYHFNNFEGRGCFFHYFLNENFIKVIT